MKAKELIVKGFHTIESMGYDSERTINEAWGYLKGVQDALNPEEEEFDQISEIWTQFHMGHHPAYKTDEHEWWDLCDVREILGMED